MPSIQQHKTRSNKAKLFKCTGFGDCQMVFTRSEHLARHTRKHTGEKPYVCIEPGCSRRFSRFDNMMQHTQTHKKTSKLKELHLTQDEFEALQGLGQFRHTPIFIDSFRDLASVVYIEPSTRNSNHTFCI